MTHDYTDLIAKLHEAAYFSPGCLAEQAADALTEAHALLWFVAHAIGHDPATTPELEVALSERLDRDQERWERAEAENAKLRRALRDEVVDDNFAMQVARAMVLRLSLLTGARLAPTPDQMGQLEDAVRHMGRQWTPDAIDAFVDAPWRTNPSEAEYDVQVTLDAIYETEP